MITANAAGPLPQDGLGPESLATVRTRPPVVISRTLFPALGSKTYRLPEESKPITCGEEKVA
ncbi:MAG: hypothetical protein E6J00_14010 [Chloroflexi bacterium]|nr:MAG: hypothetical protein E6J00_14010 [Chloroflexota bacterium]